MAVKRELFPSSKVSVAKRLKRVETIQARRKPEMKKFHVSATPTLASNTATTIDLTNIAQGTGIGDRTANEIRIHRVDIRGNLTSGGVDSYLIQSHNTTFPAYADFYPVQGGHLNIVNQNTKFTEWKYYKNYSGTNSNMRITHSFRYPMKVKFNGAAGTSAVDNRLSLVIKNDTVASAVTQVSCVVYYTDL